ncbi:class I SAM-dependent methyltransferase, partial [Candidatus Pelagibacter sp.]|nr:class I SAM-dependent methyltransferase [Candidatus Pelagibacter sp.]
IIDHKDRDKRIIFKKTSASTFFLKNKKKFDLILIKQTIHLMNIKEIKRLLNSLKKNLNQNGKIFIFTLDTNENELPTFKLMKKKLIKSLKRDKKIIKIILDLDLVKIKKKFIFKVKISKQNYLDMIKKRYISTLLTMSEKELSKGIEEINFKYAKNITFKDKLTCVIL